MTMHAQCWSKAVSDGMHCTRPARARQPAPLQVYWADIKVFGSEPSRQRLYMCSKHYGKWKTRLNLELAA